jgi:uncharacterized membrane protein
MDGWSVLIAAHASGATLALALGAVVVLRRRKGDVLHRRLGRVWVVAMYWTVISSFWVRKLNPGHLSWIHGLSAFTFITLTVAVWAALTHRVDLHKGFVLGSYFGLLGAFLGAVAVPQRLVPQLAVHRPFILITALALVAAATAGIVCLAAIGRAQRQLPARPQPAVRSLSG